MPDAESWELNVCFTCVHICIHICKNKYIVLISEDLCVYTYIYTHVRWFFNMTLSLCCSTMVFVQSTGYLHVTIKFNFGEWERNSEVDCCFLNIKGSLCFLQYKQVLAQSLLSVCVFLQVCIYIYIRWLRHHYISYMYRGFSYIPCLCKDMYIYIIMVYLHWTWPWTYVCTTRIRL
jgi:hypothetical protein